jgi:hypothetical protein
MSTEYPTTLYPAHSNSGEVAEAANDLICAIAQVMLAGDASATEVALMRRQVIETVCAFHPYAFRGTTCATMAS